MTAAANKTIVPLRYLADRYEQSQRVRIATGERIRAILQGRDADAWARKPVEPVDTEAETELQDAVEPEIVEDDVADAHLKAIVRGETEEPIPLLARTYRRHWEEERETFGAMTASLEAHPAWSWLSQVKGIGPTLACKLLARLDVTLPRTPSGFWMYCGLATVPATAYKCDVCGLERAWPLGYSVTGNHQALGTARKCKGMLQALPGEALAAMPKAAGGQKRAYDAYAKKVCYLIGCQFEKLGTRAPYGRFYREHLAKLEREHAAWAAGRRRFTALRIVEKLFLSHLYEVWREALGLEVVEHYASSRLGHEGRIAPEEMIGSGKAAKRDQ